MKKLMFAAVAAISASAFAFNHEDVSAEADGIYDLTITTKMLTHAEKTTTITFKGDAEEAYLAWKASKGYGIAGWEMIGEPVYAGKGAKATIKQKYKYYDFKVDKKTGATNYVSKVVSKSSKGVYDADSGKVYLWDTADKYTIDAKTTKAENPDILKESDKKQTGTKAYEVPLALHNKLVKTDDGKAAGGFKGENAKNKEGELNFKGIRAYGTGTFDTKNERVKTVSGNVAGMNPTDSKFGCYGTWKLNKDTKSYKSIEDALVAKKCVELVLESK